MADLYRYVHYACGILDFDTKTIEDKSELLYAVNDFCEGYNKISKYYFILHDDADVIHIHFIFYSVSQVQLMTYFNKLRKHLVPKYTRNEYGISIEKCEDFNAYLKYIVHQDAKSIKESKKQYSIEDIISNDSVELIDNYIHSKRGVIDAYYLRDCILDYPDDFDLMVKLGLSVFHKYWKEIDMLRSMRASLAMRREEEKKEDLSARVPF